MIDKTSKPGVWIYPDGREVCQEKTVRGKAAYIARRKQMEARQKHICCLFGYSPVCSVSGFMSIHDATFDHEYGRGMGGGKRDDRIEIDGKWLNGAAHLDCNTWKGSRVIAYNGQRNERAA